MVSSAICVHRDGYIVLMKRVYTEETVVRKPAVCKSVIWFFKNNKYAYT